MRCALVPLAKGSLLAWLCPCCVVVCRCWGDGWFRACSPAKSCTQQQQQQQKNKNRNHHHVPAATATNKEQKSLQQRFVPFSRNARSVALMHPWYTLRLSFIWVLSWCPRLRSPSIPLTYLPHQHTSPIKIPPTSRKRVGLTWRITLDKAFHSSVMHDPARGVGSGICLRKLETRVGSGQEVFQISLVGFGSR